MSSLYIVVKNLKVQSANASTSYLTNAYPIAATIGFIDAFRFFLKENYEGLFEEFDADKKSEAFSIIKKFDLLDGKKGFPAYHSQGGGAHKSITPSEIQLSETLCDFETTLLFKLPLVGEGIDQKEVESLFEGFVFKSRLSGGKIVNLEELNIDVCESSETLKEIVANEKGWCVMDATSEFSSVAQEHGVTEAIRQFTFTFIERKTIDKEVVSTYSKKQKGWYFLNLKGYRFLETPTNVRHGVRGNKRHAFVEPVITANKLTYFNANKATGLFWKWKDLKYGVELVQ